MLQGKQGMQTLMQSSYTFRQSRPLGLDIDPSRLIRLGWLVTLTALVVLASGCATQGDLLRLQEKVAENHRSDRDSPDPFARIAKLSTDVDALRQEVRDLQGELEVARREATEALEEVRRTRTEIARGAPVAESKAPTGATGSAESGVGGVAAVGVGGDSAPAPDEELTGYQGALDAWRADDFNGCIEQFTSFLQAYPTSGYADDAAYWLADCTYKNDEFKRAVVRFNAVVSVYPDSPKAPDALYRQGESLLKLGPKFHEAARTVFKRVQKDYPASERAVEAQQQLERLGPGKSST
jgi:tol-pal system protein YbgF